MDNLEGVSQPRGILKKPSRSHQFYRSRGKTYQRRRRKRSILRINYW